MQVIPKQNEIEIYADAKDKYVTICETDGYFNQYDGKYEDVCININVNYIDAVIEALQESKKKILMGNEIGNG